jgi:[ribosomal protein S5]-alanine N-acetyltransferase
MTTSEAPRLKPDLGDELPTLETTRLRLRPFTLADSKELQRLVGEREIADTTLNIPHPYEDGMAEAWISTHCSAFEAKETVTLAVEARDTGMLVGAVGLRLHLSNESAEIGYWIGRVYWGRGYCTEAARAMLDYAFRRLGLNRVHAAHLSRNPASGRVMAKLGMTHEGRQRQHVKKWGVFEDIEKYGILRRDYTASQTP